MKSFLARLATVLGTVGALTLWWPSSALAHTGEDASVGHVIGEVALWGFGFAIAGGGLLLLFWVAGRVGNCLGNHAKGGKVK